MNSEACFVRRDEMGRMAVYPRELTRELWDDLAAGFTGPRYLRLRRLAQ